MAWIVSGAFIAVGYFLVQTFNWFVDWPASRLLAVSLLPPAFSLALGIGWAARTRYFKQNIDGSAPASGTPLDITLRYITNTSEQTLLFALSALIFSGAAPQIAPVLLPVMGVWFLISRILFWAGYVKAPLMRAVGFASTFHPTLALILASAVFLFTG